MDFLRAVSASLLVLLLAGCASPSDGPVASTTAAPTFSVVGDNRVEAPTTDTYHLLAQPDATPEAPGPGEPIRVPVTTAFEPARVAQGPRGTWDLEMPQDLRGILGTARIWVEVKGPLVGNPFSAATGGCFWSLDAVVDGEQFGLACLGDGLQIEEGVHELVFAFALPDRSVAAGQTLGVEFSTLEVVQRAPGTVVEVLTGSAEYDSAVQVYGLELPLETEALLATS